MCANFWIVATWLLSALTLVLASWGDTAQSQYHIQTDEGPERYFRFQTDNGQFRKEKRLQDGTVIGTEAWIDAAGYLRQKDYIADKKGYRILKSKTIYVGQGRQIEDAIKSTKSVPAQSGVLVDGSAGLNSVVPVREHKHTTTHGNGGYVYSTTSTTTSTTTTTTTPAPFYQAQPVHTIDDELPPGVGKLNYLSPAEAAEIKPSTYLGFDHYPDELPRAHAQLHAERVNNGAPIVHIRPHSAPIDEADNAILAYDHEAHSYGISSTTSTTAQPPLALAPPAPTVATPILSMLPPTARTHTRRLRPIGIVSTTPAPISAHEAYDYNGGGSAYSSPAPFTRTSPGGGGGSGYHYAPTSPPAAAPPSVSAADYGYYTPNSPYDVNGLDASAGGLLPPLPARAYRRRLRPVHSNTLDAPDYDGVSVTRNGFRYFLPRQYHEEEQVSEQKRAGSFGYVDPFGIRRVVYYNASPERGFVHRNNNQYVGLGGTPYDQPGPVDITET